MDSSVVTMMHGVRGFFRFAHIDGTITAEEAVRRVPGLIRGCVPKKLMVYASRFIDDFHDAAGFGW